jgi:phage shock protein A
MIRKLIYGAGIGCIVMLFLFGRDALSYVRTSAGWVKDSVRESVPVEFQIDRACRMIASLEPEVRRNMHVIAKEEVEVERLGRHIERLEQRLTKDRADLTRLTDDLQSGKSVFYYAGRRYSDDQVKVDLANRLNRVKTNDATLINLTKVMHARERGLEAARQKLEQMLAAKRNLLVDIANLEARQKMIEVAQTASDRCDLDDSQLARTKELISEIEARIEVAERLVNVDSEFHDEIPLDPEVEEDILKQVADYLGTQPEVEAIAEVK